jgi:Domain of unknown function (DUF1996)
MRRIALLVLSLLAVSAEAQTERKTRTRNVVEDSVCAPGTGWETRPERYTSASAATVAARVKKYCAAPPPIDTQPTPPPVSAGKPQQLDQSWGTCPVGNGCLFSGVRDVRLVGSAGTATVTNVRGIIGIGCAGYAFPNGYNLGALQRCEYGPLKTVEMVNPVPGQNGFQAAFRVPMGDTGTTANVSSFTSFNGNPVGDGLGATRMKCELFKFAFDDPIVYPNQPGRSHLHMLFGRNFPNYSALTPQNIRQGSVGSTCQGGALNASAYWVPALYDTLTMEVILPRFGQFYYKSGYGVDIKATQPIPSGLVILAGNMHGTPGNPSKAGSWSCGQTYESYVIPLCSPGREYLELAVSFPSCWNGRDLDSPDHQSHMAYPLFNGLTQESVCPPSHPVLIPKIDLLFDFDLTPTSRPDRWRLVSDHYSGGPGGASAHADYMLGWDDATMRTLVTQCLNKGLDCGVGSIGSNIQLGLRP